MSRRESSLELIKKDIHMNRIKCKSTTQMTIDNDINVPDVKPDISRIIRVNGEVKIQDIRTVNARAMLKGILLFHVLYQDTESECRLQHINGQIPFDETVNMDDACTGDNVHVKWELEGLTSDIINSRKISIRAILKLMVTASEPLQTEAAVDIDDAPHVEKKYSDRKLSEMVFDNKDIIRVKDEVMLPTGRDSISEILYEEVTPEDIEMRLISGKLSVHGSLRIFTLYKGTESGGINDYETKILFEQEVEAGGCDEDMICYATASLTDCDIQIKADDDAEDRILDIEAVFGIDIKVYRENEISILTDLYSTKDEIIPVYADTVFENVVMRNNSKIRINDRITLDDDAYPIMQICNANGSVRIDEERTNEKGIEVSGVVYVTLMYFTEGEECPAGSYTGVVPFSYLIEVPGINDDCIYEMNAAVEQLNVMVVNPRENEIKAVIGIDVIVFDRCKQAVITDYQIAERDMEAFNNMPGITGYIVKNGDTLWNIAKQFYTTVEDIKEMNDINEEVKQGQKLLIVKHVA